MIEHLKNIESKTQDFSLTSIKNSLLKDRDVKNYYFLNFNCTNNIEFLTNLIQDFGINVSLNYIHGKTDSNLERVIFGYGNDNDSRFNLIKNQNIESAFKNIKSFNYKREAQYRELLHFLDSGIFDVYILGHSCGESDGALLNLIFEHANCVSIDSFSYGKNPEENYVKKTTAISKHFTDFSQFSRKVMHFQGLILD